MGQPTRQWVDTLENVCWTFDGSWQRAWAKGQKTKTSYPECIPDIHKVLSFSVTQMQIHIATLLCEIWHLFTCICKQDEICDCLFRSEVDKCLQRWRNWHTGLRWMKHSRHLKSDLKSDPHCIQIHRRSSSGAILTWLQITWKKALAWGDLWTLTVYNIIYNTSREQKENLPAWQEQLLCSVHLLCQCHHHHHHHHLHCLTFSAILLLTWTWGNRLNEVLCHKV